LADEPCGEEEALVREKLLKLRSSSALALEKGLEEISAGGEGLIERIIRAVSAGAAMSDIRTALNGTGSGELDVTPIMPRRWTEQFEALRRRTEDYRTKTGDNVKIFLANMGPIPQHKARADFITGFMEVANFDILKNDGYTTVEECAEAAVKSGGDIAVICSTDATYPELAPPLAKLIKEKKGSMKVFLAGTPAEEFKQAYLDAGVDDFINVRSNCLSVLTDLQRAKGILI
jgi:methylmalonyl-CoA mutase